MIKIISTLGMTGFLLLAISGCASSPTSADLEPNTPPMSNNCVAVKLAMVSALPYLNQDMYSFKEALVPLSDSEYKLEIILATYEFTPAEREIVQTMKDGLYKANSRIKDKGFGLVSMAVSENWAKVLEICGDY
jgi:hypothetical protein